MKINFLLLALIAFSYSRAQGTHQPMNDVPKDSVYTILYFGATSCGYCNVPENIQNITKMTNEVSELYKGFRIKKVIVAMDEDITEGLKFIGKYGSQWDEIAVGDFYYNELAMIYLNKVQIPGVPHILVIKHTTIKAAYNVPGIVKTETLVDLVGGEQINKWIIESYPGTVR